MPVDTSLCPLCGRNNQCAASASTPTGECWCVGATIAPSALARIPDSARGLSCLCPACAAGADGDARPFSAPAIPSQPQ